MRYLVFFILFFLFGCHSSVPQLAIPEPTQIKKSNHATKWLTYSKALEESKKTQKPIFLFLTMRSCDICREMKQSVFQELPIRIILSRKFIVTEVSDDGELFYQLLEDHDLEAVPSFLVLNDDGQRLLKFSGRLNVESMQSFLAIGSLAHRMKKFDKNTNSAINNLLDALSGNK